MAYLKDAYHPIRLEDMAAAVKQRSISRGTVAVTFDDGYADNYIHALPVLEDFQIPATIFVSSGYIDGYREFWWDDLERIFLAIEGIKPDLEISISGHKFFWNLDTLEQRTAARKEIHLLLKPLLPKDRDAMIDGLTHWARLDVDGRHTNRAMSCYELEMISTSQYIDIGGHTVNHPQLAALPVEMQIKEILQDRMMLENLTRKSVKTFSYPFGAHQDFSAETVEIVRSAGFEAACTTEHTRVERDHDVFLLPRYWVGDWGIEEFKNHLIGFFNN
jgi:peptidoglycan/xylan/chitin deacetylase (PgdA/CDA1 family)